MTSPSAAQAAAAGPSMPPAVVEVLTEWLGAARCLLEFGAGGSTLLAARLGVRDVVSIESDRAFLDDVAGQVAAIGGRTRLHPVHVDIGPTGAWGRPRDESRFAAWHRYPQAGYDELRSRRLKADVILVDGRFRVACLLAGLLAAAPGTRLLFDDYTTRSKYHVVERFVKPDAVVDRAALFTLPAKVDVRAAAFALARYSVQPAS
ncbi:MAG TPA: hypothetical protein VF587_08925 [Solirubrobacteraceae bacterium]|jgi:hypothetical protein